jgi:hypothetical protein
VFVTLETGRPVGGYPMLAYSVAYELEIAGVVEELKLHRSFTERLQIDLDGATPEALRVTYVNNLGRVANTDFHLIWGNK